MGLFRRDFNKPGPGISKDEPRKKGIPRFFEILTQLFGDLVKLNLMYCTCFLPSMLLFIVAATFGQMNPLLLLASLIASIPVGPGLTALNFCISKMLRDDPGFVGYDFKRKFLENFKATVLPGMAVMLLLNAYLYFIMLMLTGSLEINFGQILFIMTGTLFLGLISPYFFLQAGYMELKLPALLRNSVLLAFRFLFQSVAAFISGNAIWAVFILFFPVSLIFAPLMLLCAFSISTLIILMWIWPPVDKLFKIEETIRKMAG